ncbi:MAG: hypothetical protein C5B51_08295 [Terriglobia bacterium]|nr:MAG: hypothetical protein C5B51_08295 [Terriglobia bacterium]
MQSIKLGSQERLTHAGSNDTLHKTFAHLFEYLSTVGHGAVDIEVQHGLPFRVILERSCEEF